MLTAQAGDDLHYYDMFTSKTNFNKIHKPLNTSITTKFNKNTETRLDQQGSVIQEQHLIKLWDIFIWGNINFNLKHDLIKINPVINSAPNIN